MDSDKSLKIIITILIVAVMAQGYVLYDLNNTIKSNTESEVKEKKSELVSTNEDSEKRLIQNSYTDPSKEFRMMQKEFDRIFSSFKIPFENDPFFQRAFDDDFFNKPLVDMKQNKQEYLIKMEIPSSQSGNIKTSVENGILSVKAEIDETKESSTDSEIKKERYINKFQRSVTLPSDADTSKLKSEYKDGVLSITVPKI